MVVEYQYLEEGGRGGPPFSLPRNLLPRFLSPQFLPRVLLLSVHPSLTGKRPRASLRDKRVLLVSPDYLSDETFTLMEFLLNRNLNILLIPSQEVASHTLKIHLFKVKFLPF